MADLPIPLITPLDTSDESNGRSRPAIKMNEPDVGIEVSSLTDSPICQKCGILLKNMNDWIRPNNSLRLTSDRQSHGTICLPEAIQKALTCHLCAIFIGLFSADDKKKLENQELEIVCEWSGGKLGVMLVGGYVLKLSTPGSVPVPDYQQPHAPGYSAFYAPPSTRDDTWKFNLDDWEESKASTWSPGAIKTARNWLSACITTHEECTEDYSEFWPSRLIDIGTTGTITPRLILTAGLGFEDTKNYAALSHCWGGEVPMTLTQDNIAAMKDGIEFQDLPKTFQHAMVVTQDLQCRYIWIDSLCIIQDSHEDWLQESSQMHLVYSNSYINIAATAASNSTQGLFFHRNPSFLYPLRITLGQVEYSIDPPQSDVGTVTKKSPLGCRAWVFQESYLSPRVLHFTASQLFWECDVYACESRPRDIDITLSTRLDAVWPSYQDAKPMLLILAGWNENVSDYSSCKLTKETDKLIAFSGVATHWRGLFKDACPNDEYLAGIWRDSLPYALLWEPSGQRNLQKSYIAPSWSWASVFGQVHTPLFNDVGDIVYEAEVLSAKMQLAGPSEFGQVSGGVMTIKGVLIPIPRLWMCQAGGSEPENSCVGCKYEERSDEHEKTFRLEFTLDIPRPEIDQRRQRVGDQYTHDPGTSCLHFPIIPQADEPTAHGKDHLTVVGLSLVQFYTPAQVGVQRGLLLEPTIGDSNSGEFRRIGTFSDNFNHHVQCTTSECKCDKGKYLEASKSFKTQAERLGMECCKDENGATGEYIITIV